MKCLTYFNTFDPSCLVFRRSAFFHISLVLSRGILNKSKQAGRATRRMYIDVRICPDPS